jgi:APA family basic amino acid/polyamine antiporter
MVLYVTVAAVAVAAAGAGSLAAATDASAAPLEAVARTFNVPAVQWLVAAGAMTAMLGVLLNLILGLSRVLLAMGRRRDMPAALARLNAAATAPPAAVITVGIVIVALTLIGDVKMTWSFSAFTVLIYYALTNLAALRLPAEQRLFPAAISWMGLFSCTLLAFWIEWRVWATGLGLIIVGLAWHALVRRHAADPQGRTEAAP